MIKKILLIFVLAILTELFWGAELIAAQDNVRDSLYQRFLEIKGVAGVAELPARDEWVEANKCGFSLIGKVVFNRSMFTKEQQETIEKLLTRPTADTSIVSPSGFFRIHYFTDAAKRPTYNVNEFAMAADSSLKIQSEVYGFLPPPKDFGEGGDDKYDIYISPTGGYYGYTKPEQLINSEYNLHTSYIVVNNSFAGFYTQGINAAKVTIAHELHHAIQMGAYVLKVDQDGDYEDLYFYEMTSTSMEEFVFDYVNDYIGYMKSFFNNPEQSFSNQTGYNIAIWNIFLEEKFGKFIFRDQWLLFRNNKALSAIDKSLSNHNSSIYDSFKEFFTWSYFTGFRAVPNKYFKDAHLFPVLKAMMNTNLTMVPRVIDVNANTMSVNYCRVYSGQYGRNDSIVIMVLNTNIQKNISQPNLKESFRYELARETEDGFYVIEDGLYYGKLSAPNLFFFSNLEIINDVVIDGKNILRKQIDYVYPSPFNNKKHTGVNISVNEISESSVKLYIYDINMRLVYNAREAIVNRNGVRTVVWKGRTDYQEPAPSGVYYYFIVSENKKANGKFVVVNE